MPVGHFKTTPLFYNNEKMEVNEFMKLFKKKNILFFIYIVGVCLVNFGIVPVYATNDPLSVINNLSTFVFSLIRAVGMIILGFGVMQVGLSLKSHDPSQRANGILTLAGGVIITFAKEILNLIVGG